MGCGLSREKHHRFNIGSTETTFGIDRQFRNWHRFISDLSEDPVSVKPQSGRKL
jgi:hypothetical protein